MGTRGVFKETAMGGFAMVRTPHSWGVVSFTTGTVFPPEMERVRGIRSRASFYREEAQLAEARGDAKEAARWLSLAISEEAKLP